MQILRLRPPKFFLMIGVVLLLAMGRAVADDDNLPGEHIPSETGYMSEIQEMTNKLRPEWRSCATTEDCSLITYDCAHLAVTANRAHMQEAEDVVCQTELCQWMECAPHAYSYTAACVQGRCAIESRPTELTN